MRNHFPEHRQTTPSALFLIISIVGSVLSIAWGNFTLQAPCLAAEPQDPCDAHAYVGIGLILGGVAFSFVLASVVAVISSVMISMSERSRIRTQQLSIIASDDKN